MFQDCLILKGNSSFCLPNCNLIPDHNFILKDAADSEEKKEAEKVDTFAPSIEEVQDKAQNELVLTLDGFLRYGIGCSKKNTWGKI